MLTAPVVHEVVRGRKETLEAEEDRAIQEVTMLRKALKRKRQAVHAVTVAVKDIGTVTHVVPR